MESGPSGGEVWRGRGLAEAGSGGGGTFWGPGLEEAGLGGPCVSRRGPTDPKLCRPLALSHAPGPGFRLAETVSLHSSPSWELAPSTLRALGRGPWTDRSLYSGSRTIGSRADPHNSSVCPPLLRPRPGAVSSGRDVHVLMGYTMCVCVGGAKTEGNKNGVL